MTKSRRTIAQWRRIDSQSFSGVVVPMLMGKVPENLRNNMIRFGVNHMEWNLDDMLVALSKEVEVLEGHVPIIQSVGGMMKPVAKFEGVKSRGENKQQPTASALFTTEKEGLKKCVYCFGSHNPENCESVTDINECKNMLVKFAMSLTCLTSGYRSFWCHFRIVCKICKAGNHQLSICTNNCTHLGDKEVRTK